MAEDKGEMTIRQIAERCNVSKPTVTERLKELNLWDSHVTKVGKTYIVDDYAAATVVNTLKYKTVSEVTVKPSPSDEAVTVRELLAAQRDLVQTYQEQLSAKDAQINTLMEQVTDLIRQIGEANESAARLAYEFGKQEEGSL